MAEETDKQPERKKRRLRANTETIREQRSQRQQKEADPNSRAVKVEAFKSGFTWPARTAIRPIRALGKFRIFRFFGYILLPRYVRNSWKELKQVVWPGRSQTLRLTFAVIVFSVVFGLVVAGVDFVLDKLFKELILK